MTTTHARSSRSRFPRRTTRRPVASTSLRTVTCLLAVSCHVGEPMATPPSARPLVPHVAVAPHPGGGRDEIYVMNAGGKRQPDVTTAPVAETDPSRSSTQRTPRDTHVGFGQLGCMEQV